MAAAAPLTDPTIRRAAFEWLAVQSEVHGDVLPWALLQRGFELRGERVPLVSMQGIFKPRVMELPLSIRTAPEGGPYDDAFTAENLLRYRYRGEDPQHPQNVGLREAMRRKVPLVYLHGIVRGRYLAAWPVFIVGDDPGALSFTVAVDDERMVLPLAQDWQDDSYIAETDAEARRRYVTSLVRQRLHQRSFRERVLRAYREQCAFCRLRHGELLDAAHIVPDREARSEPRVPNGVALCKLHHAAFDALFLTVRPDDLRIVVREDILTEEDGPMLLHGLQGLHGQVIQHPRSPELRPDRELLANRWERFRAAEAAG
ncbi:MAG: HNH endonuclease [bacterium]